MKKQIKKLNEVTIRFAGDSGDGMQLTGSQFTTTTALLGNDLSTLPDYPAEIQAPAGTLFGVSGFQIHFGSKEISTPGDLCDVLVAMNPAALKVNIRSLRDGGIIVANKDGFNDKNLKLAGYQTNPLEDCSLEKYTIHAVDITKLTSNVLEDLGLSIKIAQRSKNFFALGMMYWMFSRPLESTIRWITEKFKKEPQIVEANIRVLKAGYAYGETTEIFHARYEVGPADLQPGRYRSITGNQALAWGLLAASVKSGLELFLGSYPITPASEILHELAKHKNFWIKTFQAEDEIAGISAAIGASYGGSIGVTTTSGPGLALKTEAMGLAVMLELPLVVIDVQRSGPSTGMPTKTEQADLLQAVHGRHSESPIPVIAACTPAGCFDTAYEAVRLAIKFMTPVILLSDGYLANGAESWLIPSADMLPEIPVNFRTDPAGFHPYLRDEKTLARPWAVPGTPGLEHRIGGLEKEHITGNVSYDPENHEFMVKMRQSKIERISDDIPPAEVDGDEKGDLLIVGWGGSYGAIRTAVEKKRKEGKSVSHLHLKYINPFQKNIGEILKNFKNILVPELNLGQLAQLLQARYLVRVIQLNKMQGLPFRAVEIEAKIDQILK